MGEDMRRREFIKAAVGSVGAGSNLAKAQSIYFAEIKHRPRIKLTIRQRTRVLPAVAAEIKRVPVLPPPCGAFQEGMIAPLLG